MLCLMFGLVGNGGNVCNRFMVVEVWLLSVFFSISMLIEFEVCVVVMLVVSDVI